MRAKRSVRMWRMKNEKPDRKDIIKREMKKYRTIYADPPWEVERGGGGLGANYKYPLMKTDDICALPVKEWAEENAHLYLWTTNAAWPDALKVVQAWGFKYITCITWMKSGEGLG